MKRKENSTGEGGVSRRRFLELSSRTTAGLAIAGLPLDKCSGADPGTPSARAVILINNYGGPSHLDLFDPKPDAPREVRGPFRPIRTRSAEFELTELLPMHSRIADRFSLVRTCNHDLDALHETSSRLIQTGAPPQNTRPAPHPGTVVSQVLGRPGEPSCDFLLGPTPGVPAQPLAGHRPKRVSSRPAQLDQAERERFGLSPMGDNLLTALKLVEAGARFVTVHTSGQPRDPLSWDMHGRRGFSGFDELKDKIAPRYDHAYWALITSLEERGLLDETLVCCLGEFGRSPLINPAGGRDHWTGCWTVYFAGGGIQGGRAIGRSDQTGACPADRPTAPAEIAATIYHCLGISERMKRPGGETGASAIKELL